MEEDLALWLSSGGSDEGARAAFVALHGPAEGALRHVRAGRAIAWLKDNHQPLRAAGLLALGERPEDVRLERGLADELLAALEKG